VPRLEGIECIRIRREKIEEVGVEVFISNIINDNILFKCYHHSFLLHILFVLHHEKPEQREQLLQCCLLAFANANLGLHATRIDSLFLNSDSAIVRQIINLLKVNA
jgi:hypothetical protein